MSTRQMAEVMAYGKAAAWLASRPDEKGTEGLELALFGGTLGLGYGQRAAGDVEIGRQQVRRPGADGRDVPLDSADVGPGNGTGEAVDRAVGLDGGHGTLDQRQKRAEGLLARDAERRP